MQYGLCSLWMAVRCPIVVNFCVILVSCGELFHWQSYHIFFFYIYDSIRFMHFLLFALTEDKWKNLGNKLRESHELLRELYWVHRQDKRLLKYILHVPYETILRQNFEIGKRTKSEALQMKRLLQYEKIWEMQKHVVSELRYRPIIRVSLWGQWIFCLFKFQLSFI